MVSVSASGYLDPKGQNLQQHVCLLPCGGVNNYIQKWNLPELLPIASYLKNGQSLDQMFEGFIFKGISVRQGYYLNPLYEGFGKASELEDWVGWIDELFEKDANLHALTLTPDLTNSTYDIWISLPYPSNSHNQFGPVDGKSLNFQLDKDRFSAIRWWITEFINRWKKEAYLQKKLSLKGFLWPRELIGKNDETLIKMVNEYIHNVKLNSIWLANYGSNGVIDWETLGFDTIAINPNYYGNTHVDYQWINHSANFAKYYHTGMQIIFGKGYIFSPNHYLDYFNLGLPEYQNYREESFLVYDFPNQTVKSIYGSRPVDYDRIYNFIKGTYQKTDYTDIKY